MRFSRLILTITPHNTAEKIFEDAYKNGAKGGTIFMGRTPPFSKLAYTLALGDRLADILQILTSEKDYKNIFNSIINSKHGKKIKFGSLYVIPTTERFKTIEGNKDMIKKGQLISVIVTRGYADDVMDTARKAGAHGGTIIHAHGTGRPEDKKFFGITIVPEKEQVLIAANNEKAEKIKQAVKDLHILNRPGMGIMFSLPIEEYVNLGKYKKEDIEN